MSRVDQVAVYLGDGAYVVRSGNFEVELFTTNGIEKTNSVYLGDREVGTLLSFLKANGVDLGKIR